MINSSLRVAVCPERIVEGNALKEIVELPEIIGTENEAVGNVVRELFLLLGPKKIAITNTKTAEAAKVFTVVYLCYHCYLILTLHMLLLQILTAIELLLL